MSGAARGCSGSRRTALPAFAGGNGDVRVNHEPVARSLQYLHKHFQRPINLAHLVEMSDMSRRGYVKAFTRHLGVTPGRCLRRLRMEHAKSQLKRSSESVKSIAVRSGFRLVNSFWVAFRLDNRVSSGAFQQSSRSGRRRIAFLN